ncbi:MAG: hypothetical protein Q7T03_09350 [Deltaproteobacteria bacterium]|nr:hypothetical protein [Deltaproteobacteria bacterium]
MSETLLIAFGLSVLLMALNFFAPRLRRIPFIPEHATTSFIGGFSVAFVFLELLPGLAEHGKTIGTLLSETGTITPIKDLLIYIVGLAGFLTFFGLEKLAQRKKEMRVAPKKMDFLLHLLAMGVANTLMTYTLPINVEAEGFSFALLFTLVMGLHFIVVDRTMERHFPNQFHSFGRFFLMASILLGWILAYITEPDDVYIVAMLTAFIGGSVLLNAFKEEISLSHKTSFHWFLAGSVFGTLLLVLITKSI